MLMGFVKHWDRYKKSLWDKGIMGPEIALGNGKKRRELCRLDAAIMHEPVKMQTLVSVTNSNFWQKRE